MKDKKKCIMNERSGSLNAIQTGTVVIKMVCFQSFQKHNNASVSMYKVHNVCQLDY